MYRAAGERHPGPQRFSEACRPQPNAVPIGGIRQRLSSQLPRRHDIIGGHPSSTIEKNAGSIGIEGPA